MFVLRTVSPPFELWIHGQHASLDKASPCSHIAQTYYTELMKTRNQASANRKTFDGINLQQLQADITKFWDSRNMRLMACYNALFQNYKQVELYRLIAIRESDMSP